MKFATVVLPKVNLVKSLFTEVPSATIGHAAALMSIA
jgi:hypothetical protein